MLNLNSYLIFFTVFFVAFFFSLLLIFISKCLGRTNTYKEKVSPYECGFMPYDDARGQFDIHFYIVALLFVILDIEVALIYPLIYSYEFISAYGMFSFFIFFILVGLTFIYEWRLGALN